MYGVQLTAKKLAEAILDMCPKDEEYTALWVPPELFGKKHETEGGGEPIAEEMQEALKNRILIQKANNARVPGWEKCRQYLGLAPDGYPWMQISPNCKNLLRTLPAMIHDEHRPEDLNTDAEDHACDAMRYGIVSLATLPKSLLTPQRSFLDTVFLKHGIDQDVSRVNIPGHSGYGTGMSEE